VNEVLRVGCRCAFLTSYERDNESGLDFAQARYYSGQLGRFTSVDPIFLPTLKHIDPQLFNLYSYVRNNPLSNTDSQGLDLRVDGSNVDRYVKDLEKATGLKLKYDPKTFLVTIVEAPKELSEVGQKIKDIIEAKDGIWIKADSDREDVIVDQFYGAGLQDIDYSDIDAVSKPNGLTPESIIVHATVEAWEGRKMPLEKDGYDESPEGPHKEGIRFENLVRKQQGLGERTTESSEQKGNKVIITVDLTTHIEKITVDLKDNSIKKATVEKKSTKQKKGN